MPDANKTKIPKYTFIQRNLVAIVMIPSLIALHLGWLRLQENEALVKKDERLQEFPIVSAAKMAWTKLLGDVPAIKPISGESSKD